MTNTIKTHPHLEGIMNGKYSNIISYLNCYMVLFMYLINVYMLQALHRDKALDLLKESFDLGRNQDYET